MPEAVSDAQKRAYIPITAGDGALKSGGINRMTL